LLKRKVKEVFFNQINSIINWEEIDQLIKRYYNKGFSAVGRPSNSGLLLFKITLLQTKKTVEFHNGLTIEKYQIYNVRKRNLEGTSSKIS